MNKSREHVKRPEEQGSEMTEGHFAPLSYLCGHMFHGNAI